MFDAANKSDRAYADFAARMLAATAKEESDMARYNANVTRYQGANVDTTSATVRPSR